MADFEKWGIHPKVINSSETWVAENYLPSIQPDTLRTSMAATGYL